MGKLRHLVFVVGVFMVAVAIAGSVLSASAWALDCNGNGVDDAVEISSHSAIDCNKNLIPDACDIAPQGVSFTSHLDVADIGEPDQFVDFNNDGLPDVISGMFASYNFYKNVGGKSLSFVKTLELYNAEYVYHKTGGRMIKGKFTSASSPYPEFIVPLTPQPRHTGSAISLISSTNGSDFSHREVDVQDPLGLLAGPWKSYKGLELVAADVNNDGLSDLIMIESVALTPRQLVVALSQGQGSPFKVSHVLRDVCVRSLAAGPLRMPNSYHAASYATQVVYADCNNGVHILLGNGKGNFTAPIKLFGSEESRETEVQAVGLLKHKRQISYDEDETINLILIATAPVGGRASVLGLEYFVAEGTEFGEPGASYPLATIYPFDTGLTNILEIASADLDGNGEDDLLLNGNDDKYKYTGSLLFAEPIQYLNGTPYSWLINPTFAFRSIFPYEDESSSGKYGIKNRPRAGFADFDGDGRLDWLAEFGTTTALGARIVFNKKTSSKVKAPLFRDLNGNGVPDVCQPAVPGDYNGDGKTDLVLARSLGGNWFWAPDWAPFPVPFGLDLPDYRDTLMGADYNGDGAYEPGVVRNLWGGLYWFYRRPSDGAAIMTQWGLAGDIPLTGNFEMVDRAADQAVVRNQGGFLVWYIKKSSGQSAVIPWGLAGDTPYAADLSGDDIDELIVARKVGIYVYWYARGMDGTEFPVLQWGLSTDKLLQPYDVDGDERADFAVVREFGLLRQTYVQFVRDPSSVGGVTYKVITFGLIGDAPSFGSYTGTSTADITMYRPYRSEFVSSRHFRNLLDGFEARQYFGENSDHLVLPNGTKETPPFILLEE